MVKTETGGGTWQFSRLAKKGTEPREPGGTKKLYMALNPSSLGLTTLLVMSKHWRLGEDSMQSLQTSRVYFVCVPIKSLRKSLRKSHLDLGSPGIFLQQCYVFPTLT